VIVTVCGGKGGVGKSTVALNLAAVLDGVLVDADVGMADQPTDGGPTLQDALAGRVDPEEAVRTDWAVGVLPAGRSLNGARSTRLEELQPTLEALSKRYGWIVVDAPAGFDADVALSILAADVCVLVTCPEPAALADSVRTRSLAGELGTGIGAVVLNRSGTTRAAVSEVLGDPQFAVPDAESVHEAQREGVPIVFSEPDHPASGVFRALAERLRQLTRDRRPGA
jgi:septum site-determining protein MinD